MKFASLGSGSKGNCTIVCTAATRVLFDCGFSLKETCRRLERLSCDPESIGAVIVTHEHTDHIGGALSFAKQYQIPIWMSAGTALSVPEKYSDVDIKICSDSVDFQIDTMSIRPFTISHDAKEPLQFHIQDGCTKLGILTDTGQITAHIASELSDCHALVLEFNYDEQMLAKSNYPHSLRQRISGLYGHLSNNEAAEFLTQLDQSSLKAVVAAHLSQNNNLPELALQQLRGAINTQKVITAVADQQTGFDWITINE